MISSIRPHVLVCNVFTFASKFWIQPQCGKQTNKPRGLHSLHAWFLTFSILLLSKQAHLSGDFKGVVLQSLCFLIYGRLNQDFTSQLPRRPLRPLDYVAKVMLNFLGKYRWLFPTLFYKRKVMTSAFLLDLLPHKWNASLHF